MSETKKDEAVYVPTTEEVRYGYTDHTGGDLSAEFNRWLAAHDAEVRAETLDAAQDHLLGEDDPDWAREAHHSSVSYPTVMEALDATRDDFAIRGASDD